MKKGLKKAYFAGGCFWCLEGPFETLEGVLDVRAGYSGGEGENPKYHNYFRTGHVEAVEVTYDAEKLLFKELLDIYWHQIDPTDGEGQFADRGAHYRPVIFYQNDEEKKEAFESKKKIEKSGRFQAPIRVDILPFKNFWPAEEEHQDYAKKHPERYYFYRIGSGREGFLKKIWKDFKA